MIKSNGDGRPARIETIDKEQVDVAPPPNVIPINVLPATQFKVMIHTAVTKRLRFRIWLAVGLFNLGARLLNATLVIKK